MKYRKLGNSGIDVSVIGHGTWAMGNDFFGDIDEQEAIKAIHASIDCGVNLVDTAAAYGQDGASEKVVGKAIYDRRDKVVLATKCGQLRVFKEHYCICIQPGTMRIELENSLRYLQTDYIDLYQIHRPDYNYGIEGGLEELVKMREEGKIRAIGVSNFNTDQIQTAIDIADIASVQPQLSVLNRETIDDNILSFCKENNVGVISYGSLAGGILTGKAKKLEVSGKELRSLFYNYYSEPMWSKCQQLLAVMKEIADAHDAEVAEVAINWSLANPGVTSALCGSVRPAQAAANCKAADWELSKEEFDKIEAAYSTYIK